MDFQIRTKRLELRPFAMSDLDDFQALCSQVEVFTYLPSGTTTGEETRERLARIVKSYERDDLPGVFAAVARLSDERVIGWCGLGPLPPRPEDTEVFYALNPDYWGRGYATEAARAMVGFGFKEMGLDRIVAVVKPGNSASCRVIEKLGMGRQGSLENVPEKHAFFAGLLYYTIAAELFMETNP